MGGCTGGKGCCYWTYEDGITKGKMPRRREVVFFKGEVENEKRIQKVLICTKAQTLQATLFVCVYRVPSSSFSSFFLTLFYDSHRLPSLSSTSRKTLWEFVPIDQRGPGRHDQNVEYGEEKEIEEQQHHEDGTEQEEEVALAKPELGRHQHDLDPRRDFRLALKRGEDVGSVRQKFRRALEKQQKKRVNITCPELQVGELKLRKK